MYVTEKNTSSGVAKAGLVTGITGATQLHRELCQRHLLSQDGC